MSTPRVTTEDLKNLETILPIRYDEQIECYTASDDTLHEPFQVNIAAFSGNIVKQAFFANKMKIYQDNVISYAFNWADNENFTLDAVYMNPDTGMIFIVRSELQDFKTDLPKYLENFELEYVGSVTLEVKRTCKVYSDVYTVAEIDNWETSLATGIEYPLPGYDKVRAPHYQSYLKLIEEVIQAKPVMPKDKDEKFDFLPLSEMIKMLALKGNALEICEGIERKIKTREEDGGKELEWLAERFDLTINPDDTLVEKLGNQNSSNDSNS